MENQALMCPSCGLENGADERYCGDCGALLATVSEETPIVASQPLRAVGEVLGERYRIVEAARDGGVNVYAAERLQDSTPVRILEDAEAPAREPSETVGAPVPDTDDESRVARLWRVLTDASSPHLWQVTDFVYDAGHGFLVGAPLPSRTLEGFLHDARSLSYEEIASVGTAVLDALSDLHERGLLHLGVQPAHIRIDDEGLVVLDGYQRLVRADALPERCSVTEGYSAPEAFGVGGPLGFASDVYGVGATLYFLVSRTSPPAVSREQFFVRPSLSAIDRAVPAPLEAVVMKAVRKDMAARYETAEQMKDALDEAKHEMAAQAADASALTARAPETAVDEIAPPAPTDSAPVPTSVSGQEGGFLPCRIGMKSHVGCVRAVNQDSLLVMGFSAWELSAPTEALLVVVADGMGGEAEGDKASSLAIRSMAAHLLHNHLPLGNGRETRKLLPTDPVCRLEELLRAAIETSNRAVLDYARLDDSRRGMGSTITALMIDGPHAVFAHAGDTRAYLLRAGARDIDPVTEDHSLVGKLVRMGNLTREEARVSPQRSLLYRALGTQDTLEVDVYTRSLCRGDRLLLCSDGVWEYFSEDEIVDFLSQGDDPQETCERLVAETLRRGADDNATAVVLHVTRP